MRQRWRDLLFLHFPCDLEAIAPLIPAGLSVDTFPDASGREQAWIGLVPFRMEGIRWAFAPPIPGTHAFPETNVRTYVHRNGTDPGVHFFSLDAANRLAVLTARALFSLPYFWSRMSLGGEGDRIVYGGKRQYADASYRIGAAIGDARPDLKPGSLEFFLVERYLLYAHHRGRLASGRVFHAPYGIRSATLFDLEEGLVRAAGIAPRPYEHALFSQGVDVDVYPLRPVP